jgi:hypothetical protein
MGSRIVFLASCLLFVSASPLAKANTKNIQAHVPPDAATATGTASAPVRVTAQAPAEIDVSSQQKPTVPSETAVQPKISKPVQTTPKSIPQTMPPAEANSPGVQQSNDAYNIWVNDFRRRTYENQLVQTRIIFVLVLVLVVAGLWFSWMQFQHSFHLKRVLKKQADATPDDVVPATPAQDEFAFGKDGIVVKSAYLGVIILAMSMAFFFLYLVYVYPIN